MQTCVHAPPRLLIAAPRKSSGKTLVAIGLTAALTSRGLTVQTFKKGPDFIDPMWLTVAGHRTCHNLDVFIMGPERVLANFHRYSAAADLCLIEGNMGMFDGQDPEGSDSSAALAEWLQAPVLLVVDCQGLGRSIAPLVNGHLHFPGGQTIAGVILNNVASYRHEIKLRQAITQYTNTPVIGVLPRTDAIRIDERHLGLIPVAERPDLPEQIAAMGDFIGRHLDLDRILALAANAVDLPAGSPVSLPLAPPSRPTIRVAYAYDQAFHFYYPENLEALRQQGVELVPFNLLDDPDLPPGTAGLYLGGGFPEMFLGQLAANQPMLSRIRAEARQGLPIYAECGGLMVLARHIRWHETDYPMLGLLPCNVAMQSRPQGYGYMELSGTGTQSWPATDARLRGHEFHYSKVIDLEPTAQFLYHVHRGTGIDSHRDGLLVGNTLASYVHLHADGAKGWAEFLGNFWRKGCISLDL